jgi:hypothetical protein
MEHLPILTDEQCWALLAVYEPAAATLIEVSDGPRHHDECAFRIGNANVIRAGNSISVSLVKLILEKYEETQMN